MNVVSALERTGSLSTVGMDIRAVGTVVPAGRRVATSESKLTDAGGKLLAHGTATA
jgi:acyl-coenzyme A thioesterase PaaI-like protein